MLGLLHSATLGAQALPTGLGPNLGAARHPVGLGWGEFREVEQL